jgi:hypothetical protein
VIFKKVYWESRKEKKPTMKKTLILVVALILIVMSGGLFTACAEEGPAEPVVLKMASAALFQYAEPEQAFALTPAAAPTIPSSITPLNKWSHSRNFLMR